MFLPFVAIHDTSTAYIAGPYAVFGSLRFLDDQNPLAVYDAGCDAVACLVHHSWSTLAFSVDTASFVIGTLDMAQTFFWTGLANNVVQSTMSYTHLLPSVTIPALKQVNYSADISDTEVHKVMSM